MIEIHIKLCIYRQSPVKLPDIKKNYSNNIYIKVCLVTILKSLENKTTLNIVNVSYSFTQFSTIAKTYTTNGTRTVYI